MATATDKVLFSPENLEQAKLVGERITLAFMEVRKIKPTKKNVWGFATLGKLTGERMFRRGTPWTIDNFLSTVKEFDQEL